jgi:hypothetical protein
MPHSRFSEKKLEVSFYRGCANLSDYLKKFTPVTYRVFFRNFCKGRVNSTPELVLKNTENLDQKILRIGSGVLGPSASSNHWSSSLS